jgi:hypothetical protein
MKNYLVALALTGLFSAPLQAAPYLLSSSNVDPGVSAASSNFEVGPPGPVDSGLVTSSGPGFTGAARSITDFGVMKNYATATITNYSSNTYGFNNAATATSYVSDYLTFGGGSGTGYVKLVFDVTGSTSMTADPALNGPSAQGTLAVFNKAFPEQAPLGTPVSSWGFTGAATFTSALMEFQYGAPFGLTLTSSAFVAPADTGGAYTYNFSGTADFGSTIDLSNLFVYSDAGGTQQQNFSVAALSGTAYPTAAIAAIPEPSTYALMLAGVGIVGFVACKRREQPLLRSA